MLGNYIASGAPNPLNARSRLWCEICKNRGEDRAKYCYLLHKYIQNPRNLYCKFFKLVGHDENNCRAYELIIEHNTDAYKMKDEEHGQEGNGQRGGQGGYQGRG